MKITLSEIKKHLQGINSGLDEDKNQINDLEHKEEIAFNENSKKKKESKKIRMGQGASGTMPTPES